MEPLHRNKSMAVQDDKYGELAKLLKAGLSGNQEAYTKFLSLIRLQLRRMIAKKVSATEAEDIAQEVLISVHKARHTYDGRRPLGPWLIAIARFRIADHLRKHYATMSHQMLDIDELEDLCADVTECDAVCESVDELLIHVPERQRRILTMMHVEGYTVKQIGTALGMGESAVKVAAHRAMKKIREGSAS